MKKNVSGQRVGAQLVSATDGSAFTSAVTVSVTGDAGTQATGSVGAGACTHEGAGYHTYAPAQAETNYDLIAFTFTGTGAIPVTVQVYTSFPQTADAPTAEAIADAVWDEALAGHTTAGSAGKQLQDIATGTAPTVAAIADGVWDEASAGHATLGTFAQALLDMLAASAAIKAQTDQLVFTLANRLDVNLLAVAGSTDAATRLSHGARAIGFGTVDSGASTTSLPTSACSPAAGVADQFTGRVIVFKADTTTSNLRGAAARITASTAGGTFTLDPALPATPVSGDTFDIE